MRAGSAGSGGHEFQQTFVLQQTLVTQPKSSYYTLHLNILHLDPRVLKTVLQSLQLSGTATAKQARVNAAGHADEEVALRLCLIKQCAHVSSVIMIIL